MKHLRVYLDRMALILLESVRPEDEVMIDFVTAKQDATIPFDVDGESVDVVEKVPFEPIDVHWRTFGRDFLLSQGAIKPIVTHRNNFDEVLESFTPERIKAIVEPVSVSES